MLGQEICGVVLACGREDHGRAISANGVASERSSLKRTESLGYDQGKCVKLRGKSGSWCSGIAVVPSKVDGGYKPGGEMEMPRRAMQAGAPSGARAASNVADHRAYGEGTVPYCTPGYLLSSHTPPWSLVGGVASLDEDGTGR
jgi:hypothetical protein